VEPAKDYLYGYSCADLKDPFYMALKDAIGVQAEQNKGQFIVRDAGNDPVKQNEQLMEIIFRRFHRLFVFFYNRIIFGCSYIFLAA